MALCQLYSVYAHACKVQCILSIHDHMFHLSCKYISFYLSHVVYINMFTMCVYGNMTSECQYMFISVSNAMQSQDIRPFYGSRSYQL